MSVNNVVRVIPAWVMYFILLIPGAVLFWGVVQTPGPNPVETLEHGLGEYALKVLILGLLITPLRDLVGWNLIKFRRSIGLMAFFYVLAHLVVYLLLDKQLEWEPIIKDITKRPYIIVGVVSFLILLPLAITSNNLSIRKLGPIVWRKLHVWVYLAAILGALHFVLLKKTWQFEPLMYLAIFVLLIGYRWVKRMGRTAAR
ncbi:protein-methionine-sulfoxide reductase heme-binding subunit MsrQ [Amylibacter sp. IMCC11727]|uniref:protein-methionine-sulfoxide reductase heme-binding subunit MsrQ n=1 Tax=Amylibacter sp. IMCC11727 TaxID=3039851 RepID=UPI00244E3504|nr:protein-methionine-sulfoxide reductase heme-binding subunit MsrQ [Amylibacter sp. IMCC11727]WGI22572.1 protein-methionine-sulfoxide reductase heme-binding subunit MsrQ [Amylibacter sp. IMCC11727]